jgi:hypothetical protein
MKMFIQKKSLPEAGQAVPGDRRELRGFRDHTTAIIRRYLRMSFEIGRMPSFLGREFFRARVTSYRMASFEDAIIFVHDVEAALESLNPFGKQLISLGVLQGYRHEETARILGCTLRAVQRRFPEAIDDATEVFLRRGILKNFYVNCEK